MKLAEHKKCYVKRKVSTKVFIFLKFLIINLPVLKERGISSTINVRAFYFVFVFFFVLKHLKLMI